MLYYNCVIIYFHYNIKPKIFSMNQNTKWIFHWSGWRSMHYFKFCELKTWNVRGMFVVRCQQGSWWSISAWGFRKDCWEGWSRFMTDPQGWGLSCQILVVGPKPKHPDIFMRLQGSRMVIELSCVVNRFLTPSLHLMKCEIFY
jgi:hypothetical protein